ncbi:MAG TPA: gfo/Idh/MocA family oxidoreductase, partial [Planctomycetota bacterium]|nr:gfo/Idh/MocA family oxidoreductase [Planctomycetota bacterium]
EPHHPDLFWYGVHAVEGLYSVMGTGCESVTRVDTDDAMVVVGKWKDGRIGTFRGFKKGGKEYGVTVFGEKGERSSLSAKGKNGYANLLVEIVKFFQTGTPPVTPEECVEVLAFMQAADLSKQKGGAPARLDELK